MFGPCLSKLRCPVEIAEIKTDGIETDDTLVLRRREGYGGDAAETADGGLLAAAVALELGPVDLIGLVRECDDVVDLDRHRRGLRLLEGRIGTEPSVDLLGRGIRGPEQAVGPVDILLLDDGVGVTLRKFETKLAIVARTTRGSAYSICCGKPALEAVPSLSTSTI
jgi:hypothetical protein